MKNVHKAITDQIEEGNTASALELAKQHFPQLQNKLSVLIGKFNKIDGLYSSGAMKHDDYHVQIAAVTFNLLDLLERDPQQKERKSRIHRLIDFKTDFLNTVIGEFSRSKFVLFGTLAFVLIVGVVSAVFISSIMPTSWGKIVLLITLISFFTLVISSLGFLNAQIKQFRGTKSFLKYEEYSTSNEEL